MTIDNSFQISSTKIITPFWIGSIMSGILLGLNAPGFGTHWIGLVSFFPLLFTLEQLHKKNIHHILETLPSVFRGLLAYRGDCLFNRRVLDYKQYTCFWSHSFYLFPADHWSRIWFGSWPAAFCLFCHSITLH